MPNNLTVFYWPDDSLNVNKTAPLLHKSKSKNPKIQISTSLEAGQKLFQIKMCHMFHVNTHLYNTVWAEESTSSSFSIPGNKKTPFFNKKKRRCYNSEIFNKEHYCSVSWIFNISINCTLSSSLFKCKQICYTDHVKHKIEVFSLVLSDFWTPLYVYFIRYSALCVLEPQEGSKSPCNVFHTVLLYHLFKHHSTIKPVVC